MGWYSTPFNYDGNSPTQVRDDLQKANENFQALSDVFENGTPLSGRIKSSYIPGGGGGIGGDIIVKSLTVSNSVRVNIGVDLSASTGGFYQAAIKMPVGVPGSMIGWVPATGVWGGDSLIGVNTGNQFRVIGRPDSSGRRVIYLDDDVRISGNLTVGGSINSGGGGGGSVPDPLSIGRINFVYVGGADFGIDFRGAAGYTQAAIIMPLYGHGSFISWNPYTDGSAFIGFIGRSADNGSFVIFGLPPWNSDSRSYDLTKSRVVHVYDDLTVHGVINQISDVLAKENIVSFSDSVLGIIKQIDVYRYSLKSDHREHIGFIANELKDVFPLGVVEFNGLYSISVMDLLALLFKAVKELVGYVEDLKGNI
jgi:hypothetical protein